MASTLKSAVAHRCFEMNGHLRQAGSCDYELKAGVLRIWDKSNRGEVLLQDPLTSVINGDTGLAFANEAALLDWMKEHFFF